MTVTDQTASGTRLLDAEGLRRTLRRLAHEIVEHHADIENVVIAGIRSGGVPLAAALTQELDRITEGRRAGLAAIDVAGYRDDAPRAMARLRGTWAPLARAGESTAQTAPPIDSAVIILVDDVIQTGRTLRAALDAVSVHGRAAAVESAVLIDRGARELPLRPTYVGKNIPAASGDWVEVRTGLGDDVDGAFLVKRETTAGDTTTRENAS